MSACDDWDCFDPGLTVGSASPLQPLSGCEAPPPREFPIGFDIRSSDDRRPRVTEAASPKTGRRRTERKASGR